MNTLTNTFRAGSWTCQLLSHITMFQVLLCYATRIAVIKFAYLTIWAIVTKSGNLKFLEPSGPLRACNGTDFYFPILEDISLGDADIFAPQKRV